MFSSLFERYTKASTKSTACAQYTKEIEDLKSQLGIANKERNKLETELQTVNQNIKDWETKYNTANQNIKDWETKYENAGKAINSSGTFLYIKDRTRSVPIPRAFKGNIETILTVNNTRCIPQDCQGVDIGPFTEVWIYSGYNASGNCCHIHNGTSSRRPAIFNSEPDLAGWVNGVRYIEVRSTPERIRDNKFFWQNGYDMGKLKDYIGRVVSFVSLGNQGYALDDTGNQKVGAGYHIWQFTTSNQNQQFLVDAYGRLVRVNTDLCISAKGGALRQSRDNDEWTHWILDSKYCLSPNADKNKSIDIEGGRWDNGIKLLSYAKHGKSNQQWKPITIEGFNFLGVEVENNTLLTILFLLIVAILIYRIWICPRGRSDMGGGYGMHYNRWR